jgi:hypothetical protein
MMSFYKCLKQLAGLAGDVRDDKRNGFGRGRETT